MRRTALVALLAGASSGCVGTSSTDETTATTMSATEETGDLLMPQSGEYEATLTQQTGECRTVTETPTWRLSIDLPPEDGEWLLTEDYSGEDILRKDPYPCNFDVEADRGICLIDKKHDHNDEGKLANVTVASRSYELNWTSGTELDGLVLVDLRCEGSACDEIAPDYQVAEWDCTTAAQFTAVRID